MNHVLNFAASREDFARQCRELERLEADSSRRAEAWLRREREAEVRVESQWAGWFMPRGWM